MLCNACGEPVGDPEENLHDPENLLEILPEGPSNPDSAHIEARDGPKGPRMFCRDTGQTTKIVEGGGSGSGEEEQPNPEPNPEPSPSRQQSSVYEDKGDKSADEILYQVASSPVFELDDDQISELMSWSDVYDGQIPPQQVEAVLKNFKGVSKQRANLIRQKYEAKLNKWIQETSKRDTGPSLGASGFSGIPAGSPPQQSNPSRPPQPPQKPPQQPSGGSPEPDNGGSEPEPDPDEVLDKASSGGSLDRRERRMARRQDVVDTAAQKFADEAAENFAQDAGMIFTQMREIAITLFKSKAESDPEWYFEKLEKWDMDLFDSLMEESDHKKQQDQERTQSSVDSDIDDALASMGSSDPVPEPQTREPEPQPQETQEPESTNNDDVFEEIMGEAQGDEQPEDTNNMEQETETEDAGDQFSELMGDLEVQ